MMGRLEPGRIGRVSMRPPVGTRYRAIGGYPHISKRRINAVDAYREHGNVLCAWCCRSGTTYQYRPRCYEFSWYVDTNLAPSPSGNNDIFCCNWACFDQWLDYHFMIIDEIDLSLLMGVMPEYVPEWYMPREVLESMLTAAQWLLKNRPYRCSETERWVAPRSLQIK